MLFNTIKEKVLCIAIMQSIFAITIAMFTGDLTAYGADLNNGFCGFKNSSWNYNGVLTAAINQPQIDHSRSCGLCAAVSYNGKTTMILIDNLCSECKSGDLDLSLRHGRL